MKKLILITTLFVFINNQIYSQRVQSLIPSITVDSIFKLKPFATKMAVNPLDGHIFYSTIDGNIYEVFISQTSFSTDSLRFSSEDHGITTLQGFCFRDSVIYVCGNVRSATIGIGKITKGVLQTNGSRNWVNVVSTEPYPTASTTGDHGFTGVNIDPKGNHIYVSSGARTSFGEKRDNSGAWPGKREVPLTTRIFRFPINTIDLTLPNDSIFLDNSPYVYAWGTRNAYDMAWDANDTLFAIDNSGERDDPDELNWLRQGKHYGFPWRMGGNDNPLQVSPYNAILDPLVNQQSGGFLSGFFADDPLFPQAPEGISFTEPVRNYGNAADFYKDPISGNVKKASDSGDYISTFTSHRSPLGLVFDRDDILSAPFTGSGFVLSFMPGGDSSGFTPLSPWGSPCPFVDSSRELVQMKLSYDAAIDNYKMTTSNVVTGFYLPVDAEFIENELFVIENGGSLWKLTFPKKDQNLQDLNTINFYPNPFSTTSTLSFSNPSHLNLDLIVIDMLGQEVQTIKNITTDYMELNRSNLKNGVYIIELRNQQVLVAKGKVIVN